MSESIPRIRVYASHLGQSRLVQREVIRLVLYLPFDHEDLAVPVRQSLDLYLGTLRSGSETFSEWYDLETEPCALDEDHWEIVRAVMAPPRGTRFLDDLNDPQEARRYIKNQFERAVELSEGSDGTGGHGFFYRARLPWREPRDTVSMVGFSWPTESLEEQGPRMRKTLLKLASMLPFASGHAGLAFSSTCSSVMPFGQIREHAFRHPGMDVTQWDASLGRRIDGVHWMNFLGPSLLADMGGLEGLRSQPRSPDTTLQDVEGGRAVVTLGPWPKAGDTARGDSLPDHQQLARAWAPWLSPQGEGSTLVGASPSESRRWWRRFLDD